MNAGPGLQHACGANTCNKHVGNLDCVMDSAKLILPCCLLGQTETQDCYFPNFLIFEKGGYGGLASSNGSVCPSPGSAVPFLMAADANTATTIDSGVGGIGNSAPSLTYSVLKQSVLQQKCGIWHVMVWFCALPELEKKQQYLSFFFFAKKDREDRYVFHIKIYC